MERAAARASRWSARSASSARSTCCWPARWCWRRAGAGRAGLHRWRGAARRCTAIMPARPPRWTANWWTSSAISTWCARSARRSASRRGIGATIGGRDGRAPRAACYYLEHLRLIHAVLTAMPDRRRGRLGHPAVAARPGEGGRPRADHLARLQHPARHARPRGGAGGPHPAHRPAGGGDRRAADRRTTCRTCRRAAAGAGGRARWRSSRCASPIPGARRCCTISTW